MQARHINQMSGDMHSNTMHTTAAGMQICVKGGVYVYSKSAPRQYLQISGSKEEKTMGRLL